MADAVSCYFFSDVNGNGTKLGFHFGEFFSFLANDPYRTLVRYPSASAGNLLDGVDSLASQINNTTNNAYIPRGHTGVLPPVNVSITGDYSRSGGQGVLRGAQMPYPNPADGGLYLAPVWISDPSTAPASGMRGRMRGFWHLLQPIAGIPNNSTFSGTGDLAGRSFQIILSGNSGAYVMETSATLETN